MAVVLEAKVAEVVVVVVVVVVQVEGHVLPV